MLKLLTIKGVGYENSDVALKYFDRADSAEHALANRCFKF
jgi:hypothetical protein